MKTLYSNLLFLVLLLILGLTYNSNLSKNTKLKSDKLAKENFVEVKSQTNAKLKQATKTSAKKTPAIEYFNAKVDGCNNRNCFPTQGACTSTTTCHCMRGMANVPKISKQACSYYQKKQITAFLLEFFLASGIGHFYRGVWWLGLIKILVGLVIPILLCSLMCCVDCLKAGCVIMSIIFPLLIGIWWLVDIILFGINFYHDGNGVPLESW